MYKKVAEGLELPDLNVEIETFDYMGQSTNLHKVYSEHGSPMNEYYQAGGEVVAQKMFGNKGRISPAKEATLNTNGGLMYYTYDGLGTVTALHDRHGDKIEDYRYDAFGNLQTGITSPYNVQGYTGHLYDDKSSLVFMNARWYNPSVGRFMSKDTYRGDLAVPQSLNQYAYVMNNPINYVDPTGHIHVYSSGELEGWSRDSLKSLLVEMGVYWNADKEKFEETGVWTQQQEDAHANADLIRELIPYSYEYVRSSSDMSPFVRNTSKTIEAPKYIIYTNEATKTITDYYANDFNVRTETTVEHYEQTEIKFAANIAANNQMMLEADYGPINQAVNRKSEPKLVKTDPAVVNSYTKAPVKSTKEPTPSSSLTNVNNDVVSKESEKSGVSARSQDGYSAKLESLNSDTAKLIISDPQGKLMSNIEIPYKENYRIDVSIEKMDRTNIEVWSQPTDTMLNAIDELAVTIAVGLYTMGMISETDPSSIKLATNAIGIIKLGTSLNIPSRSGDIKISVNVVDPDRRVNETEVIADYEIIDYLRYDDAKNRYVLYNEIDNGWYYPLFDGFTRKSYYPSDYNQMDKISIR